MARSLVFSLFVCLGLGGRAEAFNCRALVYSFKAFTGRVLPIRGALTLPVETLLVRGQLEVTEWRGEVAVLRGSGRLFTGTSASVYNNVIEGHEHGRLSLRLTIFPRGLVVYILDRKASEVVFVGVPEGHESMDPHVIREAHRLLREGPVILTSAFR